MAFAFGKNWESYSKLIGETEILAAEAGMLKLLSREEMTGRSFIDIGCGSGLHSLAAHRLGAGPITSIDVDPYSVKTARAVLQKFGADAQIREASVFDLSGQYDIVYSWGVLHHTGDMWRAIDGAAALVKPGGLFVIALYQATPMDKFWIAEKAIYSKAPRWFQGIVNWAYRQSFRIFCKRVTWHSYGEFLAGYKKRGMEHRHDVHDWLGGYPYETASETEVTGKLEAKGFQKLRQFIFPIRMRGLFGSACDEYVFRKNIAA